MNRKLLSFSQASVGVRGKVDDQELLLAPEVVDDEPNQEKKKDPQYNPQCDSYYHADLARPVMLYLGSAAGAGFISRKNRKNSDFVERISVSF